MPDKLKQRDALLDGCRDLARGNLQGRHFAGPLYKFLAPLDAVCSRVFDSENEARLRRAACQLVGIGKGLHPDYRASLVFEDVLYAPLSGLTHKERAYLALILFHSYTRSQKTPNNDALNLLLSLDERRTARIYGTAIRLGVVVSGRSPELLKDFELTFEDNKLGLAVSPMRQSLLTERVTIRLERLGRLLGLDTVANIVSR
jgi:exopolyphosphatase/guanosine-5'-triphosphate,3'-diphosphate pyrophosphatase